MNQESASNRKWLTWLGGAAMGAAAMYFSDPDRGRRRRALVEDKLRHFGTKTSRSIDVAARDLSNRLQGLPARARHLLPRYRHEEVDDRVLAARVRAKIGRVVSHSHAINVTVQQGTVILSGPVLANEREQLFAAVRATAGVATIEDTLEVHERPTGVPGLQGISTATGTRSEFLQENWPPAWRGAAILSGSALSGYGLARRTPAGIAMAAAGLMLLVRGITNMPMGRLTGMGASERGIELQKAIEIKASPEVVFDAWSKYENFPYFMSHVLEVRDLGNKRSHWVVEGPMGTPIEWDVMLVESERPNRLSWRSEPGSAVEHTGSVRFDPAEGGTRATVRLSYHPPGGALGHGVATLLGKDPKHELDDDLMRMKSFIETGTVPHDAARSVTAAGIATELHPV